MKTLLWLDDIRDPFENSDWLVFSPIEVPYKVSWVKTFYQFTNYISQNGLPDGICFDHDLGDNYNLRSTFDVETWYNIVEGREYTGYDCAKWLVDYCLDTRLPLPSYNVHSANPVGKKNIISILENYRKFSSKKQS